MRKLSKLPEPEILRLNGAMWLQTLEDKLAAGEPPSEAEKTRYRHPQIKAVLKAETSGKCAYCESRMLHVAFGDVEHISPKSQRLADTFRWDNLTLACDACNTFKKDKSGIVDPYVDDPGDIFNFVGPMIYAKPGSGKAVLSLKALKLNRIDLVADRVSRLDAISSILLTAHLAVDAEMRSAIFLDLLETEASDSGEYSAFVKSFLLVVEPGLFEPCTDENVDGA